MAVYDHWAYIFALLLYAPVRVEAAVVVPPPEVMAAQHWGRAPVVVAKPLPKVQCGCLTVRVADGSCSPSSQAPRTTTAPDRQSPAINIIRKLYGGR